jgi:hypothetical protein
MNSAIIKRISDHRHEFTRDWLRHSDGKQPIRPWRSHWLNLLSGQVYLAGQDRSDRYVAAGLKKIREDLTDLADILGADGMAALVRGDS